MFKLIYNSLRISRNGFSSYRQPLFQEVDAYNFFSRIDNLYVFRSRISAILNVAFDYIDSDKPKMAYL